MSLSKVEKNYLGLSGVRQPHPPKKRERERETFSFFHLTGSLLTLYLWEIFLIKPMLWWGNAMEKNDNVKIKK